MVKYCKYCGEPLVKDQCVNPDCLWDEDEEPELPQGRGRKRPISLIDRRRQMYEAEQRKLLKQEGGEDPGAELQEERETLTEEGDAEKVTANPPSERRSAEESSAAVKETVKEAEADEGDPTPQQTHNRSRERKASASATKDPGKKKSEKSRHEELEDSAGVPIRLFCFVSDYYRNPGKETIATAREQDVGVGLALTLISLCLSAFGALIFGALYLEDFLLRWVVCGIGAPILAYGFSLLYGRAFVALRLGGKNRENGKPGDSVTFRELFSVVTAASMLPNILLLLSCVLSPMDKDLRIFQFFALLLTLVWIVSLLFSLFTVYGGDLSVAGLILTVLFVFLAFVAMRTLWVWYLTGEFRFTFYVPLSVFME